MFDNVSALSLTEVDPYATMPPLGLSRYITGGREVIHKVFLCLVWVKCHHVMASIRTCHGLHQKLSQQKIISPDIISGLQGQPNRV